MSLYWLDPAGGPVFPDTALALEEPNGLLAAGGALDPDWLTQAYSRGIFPWFSDLEPILWWSPSPRCVFLPNEIRTSRRLRRAMRQQPDLRITLHRDFPQVLAHCADIDRPGQSGTWITPEMEAAYLGMHDIGRATAIAVWSGKDLVGGLYGVTLGCVLFGESMFSRRPDASKIALSVAGYLGRQGVWELIDAQVESPHLMRMGARLLERETFETRLQAGLAKPGGPEALPEELDLNAFLQDISA